jgi:hypothetical protein
MVLVFRQNLKFDDFWIFFDFSETGSIVPSEIIDKSDIAFLLLGIFNYLGLLL